MRHHRPMLKCMALLMLPLACTMLILGSAAAHMPALTTTTMRDSPYTPNRQRNMCSSYGTCGDADADNKQVNCNNNTAPVVADFDPSGVCSQYTKGQPLCCDEAQYKLLSENLQQADAILGRCSACLQNFQAFFCTFTCDPSQAYFTEVLDVTTSKATNLSVVTSVGISLSDGYAAGLYTNCKDVQFGTLGSSVFEKLFNAHNMYELYDSLSSQSPIALNFTFVSDDNASKAAEQNITSNQALTTAMQHIMPCNTSDVRYQCSCTDCEAQCPVQPHIEASMYPLTLHLFDSRIGVGVVVAHVNVLVYLAALTLCYTQYKTRYLTYTVSAISLTGALALIIYASVTERSHKDFTADYAHSSAYYHVLNSWIAIWFTVVYALLVAGQLSLLVYNYFLHWCSHNRLHSSMQQHSRRPSANESPSAALYGSGHADGSSTNGSQVSVDADWSHAIEQSDSRSSNVVYKQIAYYASHYPWSTIGVAALTIALTGLGVQNLHVETNPTKLWVPPNSELMQQKQHFDDVFGSFYRVSQLFMKVSDESQGQLLTVNSTLQLQYIQSRLQNISAIVCDGLEDVDVFPDNGHAEASTTDDPLVAEQSNSTWTESRYGHWQGNTFLPRRCRATNRTVSFTDVCYKPIPGGGCLIESVTEYFTSPEVPKKKKLNTELKHDDYIEWINTCTKNPTYAPCRGILGTPTTPYVVLGGYHEQQSKPETNSTHNKHHKNSTHESTSNALALTASNTTDTPANIYLNSTAFVVTYLYNAVEGVQYYELAWLDLMQQLEQEVKDQYTFSYNVERSIEDELERSRYNDVDIVILSYVAMFTYVSIALGRFDLRNWKAFFVNTKFSVGFAAIAMVLASLVASVGIVATCGVPSSPIIGEVIPFLVLAIGIDNVFLLLTTYQSTATKYSSNGVPSASEQHDRLYETLQRVGLSITLATSSEAFAFLLGAFTRMPAVQGFAYYAAAAITIDYLLQMTVLLAVLVLDERRIHRSAIDCLPCISLRRRRRTVDADSDTSLQEPLLSSSSSSTSDDSQEEKSNTTRPKLAINPQASPLPVPVVASTQNGHTQVNNSITPSRRQAHAASSDNDPPRKSILHSYVTKFHTPYLILNAFPSQLIIILLFPLLLLVSFPIAVQVTTLGLDQKTALPNDSYLQRYFDDLQNVLRVGPPLYLVLDTPPAPQQAAAAESFGDIASQDSAWDTALAFFHPDTQLQSAEVTHVELRPTIDWTNPNDQNLVCSISGCNSTSLAGTTQLAVANPTTTTIAAGVSSWLDDYLSWLGSRGKCCMINDEGAYCPPGSQGDCHLCIASDQFMPNSTRPTAADFQKYLHMFLYDSRCSTDCGLCGYAHVGNVKLTADNTTVEASRYMTYHTQLHRQSDYIHALEAARTLAADISQSTGLNVFAYSLFYVYFEQYLYIVQVAITVVCLALLGIALLAVVLLGNLLTAGIIVLTVMMTLGDLLAAMVLLGIDFNAVSVLNYVMSIGLCVEFCIHIAASFLNASGTRHERIAHAMEITGTSVISGITLTKAVGISILSLASSQIFVVYYFRMYAAIVVLAALHGLVFMPTLLAMIGPPSRKDVAADGQKSWWQTLLAWREE